MKTKQDVIKYLTEQLQNMNMTLVLSESDKVGASFIYNKYDRSRAQIKLNTNRYTLDELIAVALHELGHARMYQKYSIREYQSKRVEWHEVGAWDIAFYEAEKLGIKINADVMVRGLTSYDVGIEHIEGLVKKWNHCLYLVSYA